MTIEDTTSPTVNETMNALASRLRSRAEKPVSEAQAAELEYLATEIETLQFSDSAARRFSAVKNDPRFTVALFEAQVEIEDGLGTKWTFGEADLFLEAIYIRAGGRLPPEEAA